MDSVKNWVQAHKAWSAVIGVVVLLIIAGAVAPSESKDDAKPEALVETSAPTTTPPTTAPSTAPPTTPAPKPTKSKNPLDTSSNDTACSAARRAVGKKQDVFSDFSKGTASIEDATKAAKDLQNDLGDSASYSSGAIQVQLAKASDAYGRVRVGLTDGPTSLVSRGVAESSAALEQLDTLCTSIGE